MKIVCCSNMPMVKDAFSTLGEPILLDGRKITANDVKDAEILAVRSTTKINKDLLQNSKVKFVGTATIGIDHIDIPWLEKNNIKWSYSPGCNANSVSEYITAALLTLAIKNNFQLKNKTIGIIGVGNVGTLVAKKAKALNMKVLLNDPPKKKLSSSPDIYSDINDIKKKADIITFHVPLIKEGPYKTFHMANASFFKDIKPGTIIINSSRGSVVDNNALKDAIKAGIVSHTVLDVWENEPNIDQELLNMVDIGTPHIAGHSYEGKVVGTYMVYKSACDFLNKRPSWNYEDYLPPPLVPEISLDLSNEPDEKIIHNVVKQVYDIEKDFKNLSNSTSNIGKHFDYIRKNYPVRREFRFTKIKGDYPVTDRLKLLGFN